MPVSTSDVLASRLPPGQDQHGQDQNSEVSSRDGNASTPGATLPDDSGQTGSAGASQGAQAGNTVAYLPPPDATTESGGERNGKASGPPRPAGMPPQDGESFFGTWIRPLGLRGALATGYGAGSSLYNGQPDTSEHSSEFAAEVSGSVALLDRRVLSIDYSAGFQKVGAGSVTAAVDSQNSLRATNLGLSADLLSGRSAPLRVFINRSSAGSRTGISFEGSPESLQDATGEHSTVGFAWDVAIPHLPKIQLSGTKDSNSDVRNFLFGQSQWTTERRAEVRATESRARFGYDATYRFDDYDLEIPDAGLSSQTTLRMFTGAMRLEPSPKWRFNLDGRSNRYRLLGGNKRDGETSGLGVNASVRFAPTPSLFTSFTYQRSTSVSEALLSGQLDPGQVGVEPAASASIQNRLGAEDLEGRVGYLRQAGSIELFARSFSLGVPAFGPASLSSQRTVGATARAQRPLAGFQLSASVEGEFGEAISTRDTSEPYQTGGVQVGLSRPIGRVMRFGVDGLARQARRLTFYTSPLAERSAGARFETLLPAWARLTASGSWSSIRRDAITWDFDDRFVAWSVGVAGSRYDASFDVNRADAHPLLLSPDLLGRRVDLAILLDRQPELLGAFLGSAVRSRRLSAHVEPWRRLQVRAFVQREARSNALYDQRVDGEQVSVVYALRQVQLEAGWNHYLVSSTLAVGRFKNQRFFVRIRRDISVF